MKSPDTFTDFQKNVMQEQNSSSEMASSETDMTHENIVTFNIGGVIFQTLESTLKHPKRPAYRLLDSEMLERHWDEERCVYFFDRDPAVFQTVLNYLRTGVLHLPQNMCSPQITTELLYWGLPRIDIQPCCWKDYSFGIQTLENLRKLEKDRRPAYANPDYFNESKAPATGCNRIVSIVWNVVTDPSYSTISKMYGTVALVVIVSSIFNFTFATTLIEEDADLDIDNGHNWGNMSSNSTKTDAENSQATLILLNKMVDYICFSFFLFDLLAHIFSCPNMKKYLTSIHFWVDLLAIMPDVLTLFEVILGNELGHYEFFSLLKFMRLFRVFRLMIRVTGVMTILYTLWASTNEIFSIILLLVVCTLIFASIVFYAEDAAETGTMVSVFESCWWSITTLTTVGYGDVIPKSVLGQTVGGLCAFSGVILLGITVPTMVMNFITFNNLIQYMQEREMIFLYRVKGDFSKLPKIHGPDWY